MVIIEQCPVATKYESVSVTINTSESKVVCPLLLANTGNYSEAVTTTRALKIISETRQVLIGRYNAD